MRRFLPGQRLTEEHLAREYGVSRVPVRGALHHLEAEGFTRTIPFVGAAVAELSDAEADDLLEVQLAVATRTVQRAAERRTDEHLLQFDQILGAAESAHAEYRLEDLDALEARFHHLIGVASATEHLHRMSELLAAKLKWINPANHDARTTTCWHEHLDLFVAIRARDPEAAGAHIDRHIRRTAYVLRS
jgi:DNA-binding GntR family transcriptional regulator